MNHLDPSGHPYFTGYHPIQIGYKIIGWHLGENLLTFVEPDKNVVCRKAKKLVEKNVKRLFIVAT